MPAIKGKEAAKYGYIQIGHRLVFDDRLGLTSPNKMKARGSPNRSIGRTTGFTSDKMSDQLEGGSPRHAYQNPG